MSAIAVAGYVPVDGPLPRERVHSLLTVPGVVVPTGELEDHWQSGINVYGYPEDVPTLWEGCSAGTFRVKDEGDPPPVASFTSFVIYVPINCTAMGIGDPEEFAGRAEDVLRATQAWAIEQALAQGVPDLATPNPYLGDANLDILATGVSVGVGLSYLENAIAATGRQGLIHVTPAAADALSVAAVSDLAEPIYTVAGTPVSIGAGYVGTDPVSGASPGATTDWIFATGPVQVRIEPNIELVPDELTAALDTSNNDVVYRAEKAVVVSWDTALQAGVLVDWSL